MDRRQHPAQGQGGFSMVELLMVAFILAVGLLGLGMLQVYSLRTSREARTRQVALKVAEALLDRAEQEARGSWIHVVATDLEIPGDYAKPILDADRGGPLPYTVTGRPVDAKAAEAMERNPFFRVQWERSHPAGGEGGAGTVGRLSDLRVTVSWDEVHTRAGGNGASIQTVVPRSLTLCRRFLHA